jgi:uncharacterized delta-60 repeat protein
LASNNRSDAPARAIRGGLRIRFAIGAVLATALAGLSAAQSGATPGLLDPTFGNNGLTVIGGGDKYEAQGAPLVASDGKIAVAGLLKNSSDRVFLSGLAANGATDQSFGTAGTVQTSTKATERRAVTARQADGKLLIAGKSDSGRLQLERFLANGARDTAYGSNGTLTATVPNNNSVPTAMVTSGSSTWVTLMNSDPNQRKGFAVAKLTATGLDSTFGTGGVATFSFGSTFGQPLDIALADGGKLVVTGSYGRLGANGTDTRVARLNPSGSLDTSLGTTGLIQYDASQANKTDNGVAVLPVSGGGMYVVSAADGKTAVAKLTNSGAADASYAGDGIAQGLSPNGAGVTPTDAILDPTGRVVVVGKALSGSTTSWAALRTQAGGANPLDTGFFQGGYAVLDECQNTGGYGPSGVTATGADTVLIAGGCTNTDAVAIARLKAATKIVPTSASLDVTPQTAAAGHERIPLSGVDASAVLFKGAALQSAALRNTALRNTALRNTALRNTALRNTALRNTALRNTLLSEIALRNTSWQQLLGVDVPLQTLTLLDAYNINPDAVGALTLADIDLGSTALRNTTLAALVLGARPLDALPAPDGGWCSFLASMPYNCSNGVSPAVSTLFELEISGDDLSAYYTTPIALSTGVLGSGDGAAPLAAVRLADMNLDTKPFADAKASDFGSILACGGGCQGTLAEQSAAQLGDATVGQLVALLPKPSLQTLSVGEALVAMIPAADIPYELTELPRLLDESEYRGDGLQTYTLNFSVDCGQVGGLRAVLQLADDARPVPDSASVSVGGGSASPVANPSRPNLGDDPIYDLGQVCSGRGGPTNGVFTFKAEPGSQLGLDDSTVRLVSDYGSVQGSSHTAIDDSRDPGDDLDRSLPLGEEAIRTGHIASDLDVDTYSFTAVAGKTTITVSQLPADYDVAIFGPELGPDATALRNTALRNTALRNTPVPDSSEEPTDPAVQPPDTVQDLALRNTALRNTALRNTSINRGTGDESATVDIRPEEAGETFYAQVIGYDGAQSADPYVIRRIDRPDPPALDCPARSMSSSFSVPFPGNVPAGTQALMLVAPERLAALYGATQAQNVIDRLNALAAQTNGLVVPVTSDPTVDVGSAFAAADATPCSAERANDVVGAINQVVDHVRQLGGGLGQLRSIVLVGSDEVLPQARVPDYTALANESDYADSATLNTDVDSSLEDNAVSRSLRDGFLLSDDPYGDFDPGPRLSVPDVALGRLVETPDEITGQIDSFLQANGVLNPQRAFVTGYDFLSDGATDELNSLTGAVPSGSAQGRIDETWTASDAAAGLSASGAGFLAPNAHFDHHRLLPAAAFNGYSPNLLSAADTNPTPGSIAFTVGCHAGLNLAVASVGGSADPRLGDWAQQMASHDVVFAGNTGFGYGDSESIAYSERLMADYAHQLASGQVTSGQAMMLAKQQGAASAGIYDDYWNKSSMEATFYGVPMYRIGSGGGVGAPALPRPDGTSDTGPTTRSSTPLSVSYTLNGAGGQTADVTRDLHQVDTDRGTYFQVGDEDPLVVQHRPIEPKTTIDVTDPNARAKSFLIESLTTQDGGINPVIGLPTVDLEAHETEPDSDAPFFPARLASVEESATAAGPRDALTLIAGSTRDNTQRLVRYEAGRVMRSTSNDFDPPTIRRVDGDVLNGSFSIRVEADGGDVLGGNVLYVTDAEVAAGGTLTWHRANLSVIAPGVLGAGGALPNGTAIEEAIVQVYDTSNNVAISSKKVEGHSFEAIAAPDPGDPKVVLSPAPPASGYYASSPTVSLDQGDHASARFEVSIDGDDFRAYDGQFTVPGDGEHQVYFRGSDDSFATARFAIDSQPPTITATADHAASPDGWYKEPVTVSFTCADAVSGVGSCPSPVTLGEGRGQSASGTATDNAGHSATTSFGPFNVDLTKPTISGRALTSPNANGWYNASATVRYTCSDSLSGLDKCAGKSLTGGPATATNDAQVATEGLNQTLPETALDLAGNSNTGTVSPALNIDLTAPDVTITTPNNSVIIGALGQRVQGTASDALSRVDRVEVTYVRANGNGTQVKTAALTCNASGSCTWAAAPPTGPPGGWRVSVRAFDKAGNAKDASSTIFISVS